MPRTELFSHLRKLALQHRQAHRLGKPVEELRERRARELENSEGGVLINRRELLTAMGAAAVSLALPPAVLAHPPRNASQPSIAIIGAGIAGLTCAWMLANKGLKATVFEASNRVGGRMFSNTAYWDQGQVSELCGELIDTGHVTIQRLAADFGLELENLIEAEPERAEDTYFFNGKYYKKSELDKDFDDLLKDTVTKEFKGLEEGDEGLLGELDQISIHKWIATRIKGGHSTRLGQLLDTAYTIEFGADTNMQSALNIVYMLGDQPANSTSLSVFGASDEKFHIKGGNEQLPRAIAEKLGFKNEGGHGIEFKMHRALTKIEKTSSGRYRLSFDKDNSATQTFIYDYVVLAIPFAVLRTIDYRHAGFNEKKNQAIQKLGGGINGKFNVQFKKRHWNKPGAWPGVSNGASYADTGYQSSWEVTRGQAGEAGILTFYSGGSVTHKMHTQAAFGTSRRDNVKADLERTLTQAERVFPGLEKQWNGKAQLSLPHKSPLFRASYAYYKVGQYTAFGEYEGVRQGQVFFCGEHTSVEFQGYMEGGASEGERVGKELVKLLKNYCGEHKHG